jgi:DNA-nicking Smr family endonuclease
MTTKRGRSLRTDEAALFAAAMHGVKRLDPATGRTRRKAETPPAAAAVPAPAPPQPARAAPTVAPAPARRGGVPGLDSRTDARLRRGQLPIEATLDLHHRTQAEAHVLLHRFLADAAAAGKRCVLIITGKGGRPAPDAARETGVLKRALPRWLEAESARVLACRPAQAKHGGGGAFYVLLRRKRG